MKKTLKKALKEHNFKALAAPTLSSSDKEFLPIIIMPNLQESNLAYLFNYKKVMLTPKVLGFDLTNFVYLGALEMPPLAQINVVSRPREKNPQAMQMLGGKFRGELERAIRIDNQKFIQKLPCTKNNCDNSYQLRIGLNKTANNPGVIYLGVHKFDFLHSADDLFPKTYAKSVKNINLVLTKADMVYPRTVIFNRTQEPFVLWVDKHNKALGWQQMSWEHFSQLKPMTAEALARLTYSSNYIIQSYQNDIERVIDNVFLTEDNPVSKIVSKVLPEALLSPEAKAF